MLRKEKISIDSLLNTSSLLKKQKGFTLVEIIDVLLILSIVAAFHINSLILMLLQEIESLTRVYPKLTEGRVWPGQT